MVLQAAKIYRWNCNVFGRARKLTVRNYVRDLSGVGAVACGSYGVLASFAQCLGIGGGFALHEALWLSVGGVSDPHVVQIPPIAGAEAASGADDVPKV